MRNSALSIVSSSIVLMPFVPLLPLSSVVYDLLWPPQRSQFVAIYLVSHNIGYQFQELAYFNNTRKSTTYLCKKYQKLLSQAKHNFTKPIPDVYPIQVENLSLEIEQQVILAPLSLSIKQGEKNCHHR